MRANEKSPLSASATYVLRTDLGSIRLARALLGFVVLAVASSVPKFLFGQIAPGRAQDVQKPPDQSSIRVNVELVNTPVVVRDQQGELVYDLGLKNFRVFDNGVPQVLDSFELGGAPLSAAIVIENSSRVEGLLPLIRRTGILFTETILGENGEAAVFEYDDNVNTLLDFTSDHNAIEKTVTNLREGTSGACLYDALSEAAGVLRNRPASRRRVIITLAEAAGTGCEVKLGQALRELQLDNITVYSVGLSSTAAEWHGPEKQAAAPLSTPPGTFGLPPIPGNVQTPWIEQERNGNINLQPVAAWILWALKHATATARDPLKMTAAATGGLYQSTFDDNSIEVAIDQIGAELAAQYTLSYRLTRTDGGGHHKIKVEIVDRPKLKVRSRPGYYLGPP
jgi:VWFA-related protein